jgi:hypothetical protein
MSLIELLYHLVCDRACALFQPTKAEWVPRIRVIACYRRLGWHLCGRREALRVGDCHARRQFVLGDVPDHEVHGQTQGPLIVPADLLFKNWRSVEVILHMGRYCHTGISNFHNLSLERAIELDPNYADAFAYISYLYVGIGRIEEALSAIETAINLNPQYPFWYIQNRAVIRYMREEYEAAIIDLESAAEKSPTALFVRWWLAAAYAQAGRQDDAEWQLVEMTDLGFHSTVKELLETSVIHHPPYVERFAAGLRKAGIPEG